MFHKKRCWLLVLIAILLTKVASAQQTTLPDSTQADSTVTIALSQDSIAKDTSQQQGDIKTTVTYSCKDSIRMDVVKQVVYLYGNAKVVYGDITLTADKISFSWTSNTLVATYSLDSNGKEVGIPVFQQGNDKYTAKSIKYNFKTQKGIISEIVTQQGEGFLHGDRVKRNEDGNMYVGNAQYTTCNLAHPHYAIRARKIKMIPQKMLVTGPFNFEIADIPTPIGFAFGLFPMPKSNKSGIIIPSYGETVESGFYLRDFGYYWAVNDYLSARFTGELYSKGRWGVGSFINYNSRYKFEGNSMFRYTRRLQGDEGLQNKLIDYQFMWTHTPKTKGSSRFSANVNFVSQTFYQRNSFNNNNRLAATFNSAISYSKVFTGTPFSVNVSARQDQNVQTGIMNLTLPDVAFNMTRIFPFKGKNSSGKKIHEKINIAYNMTTQNYIRNNVRLRGMTRDTILPIQGENLSTMFAQGRYGMRHNIPVNTNFPIFKYITITPSFNYSENWYDKKYNFRYDSTTKTVLRDTLRGFARAYEYNTSISASTRLYGTFYLKSKKIPAIRHTLIPTVGMSYRPDFSETRFGMYQEVQIDSTGRMQRRSQFENTLYGAPSGGRAGNINIALNNNLEAKIRKKGGDSTGKLEKVALLDNFGATASYNLAADSFNLSNIGLNARTRLFKGKLDIAINGSLSPYDYVLLEGNKGDEANKITQRRLNRYAWQSDTRKRIGFLQTINFSATTSLNPKARESKKKIEQSQLTEMEKQQMNFIMNNPNLFVDFDIPWNLNLGFQYYYNRIAYEKANQTKSLTFSGDVSLTKTLKATFNSGYDIVRKQMTPTTIGIFKDLHCWEMRVNWIPFGQWTSYDFYIGVKASMLQDLKLSRRRSFYDR
jgi:lipopolysaccharide export system protein LptA